MRTQKRIASFLVLLVGILMGFTGSLLVAMADDSSSPAEANTSRFKIIHDNKAGTLIVRVMDQAATDPPDTSVLDPWKELWQKEHPDCEITLVESAVSPTYCSRYKNLAAEFVVGYRPRPKSAKSISLDGIKEIYDNQMGTLWLKYDRRYMHPWHEIDTTVLIEWHKQWEKTRYECVIESSWHCVDSFYLDRDKRLDPELIIRYKIKKDVEVIPDPSIFLNGK